jgi:hypothetical protein
MYFPVFWQHEWKKSSAWKNNIFLFTCFLLSKKSHVSIFAHLNNKTRIQQMASSSTWPWWQTHKGSLNIFTFITFQITRQTDGFTDKEHIEGWVSGTVARRKACSKA